MAYADDDYRGMSEAIASRGRYGDTMLVHVNPAEVEGLGSLGPLTINPETGNPEAWLQLLGLVIGATAGGLTAKKRDVPVWQGVLQGAAMGAAASSGGGMLATGATATGATGATVGQGIGTATGGVAAQSIPGLAAQAAPMAAGATTGAAGTAAQLSGALGGVGGATALQGLGQAGLSSGVLGGGSITGAGAAGLGQMAAPAMAPTTGAALGTGAQALQTPAALSQLPSSVAATPAALPTMPLQAAPVPPGMETVMPGVSAGGGGSELVAPLAGPEGSGIGSVAPAPGSETMPAGFENLSAKDAGIRMEAMESFEAPTQAQLGEEQAMHQARLFEQQQPMEPMARGDMSPEEISWFREGGVEVEPSIGERIGSGLESTNTFMQENPGLVMYGLGQLEALTSGDGNLGAGDEESQYKGKTSWKGRRKQPRRVGKRKSSSQASYFGRV